MRVKTHNVRKAKHVPSCCLNTDSIDFREPHPILTNLASTKTPKSPGWLTWCFVLFFFFSKYIQVLGGGSDLSVRKTVGCRPPVQGSVTDTFEEYMNMCDSSSENFTIFLPCR